MMLMTGLGMLGGRDAPPGGRANPAAGYHRPLRRPMRPAPTFSTTSSTARRCRPPTRRNGRRRPGRTTSSRRSRGYTATIAKTCSSTATPTSSCCATHDLTATTTPASCAATGGARSTTPGKREIKLDCLYPGLWPSFWARQRGSAAGRRGRHLRVVRQRRLGPGYHGPRGIQRENLGRQIDPRAGRRRRGTPGECIGTRTDSNSGGTTSTVRSRTSACRRKPIHVAGGAPDDLRWPFNNPGYWMSPMFTLAVGGVGAGDPAAGVFPAAMLDRLHPRLVAITASALIT